MPQAALEEVGLCRVDPAVLRELYGFAPGELPPLGASPDGLIRQRQPSPASAVRPVSLSPLQCTHLCRSPGGYL